MNLAPEAYLCSCKLKPDPLVPVSQEVLLPQKLAHQLGATQRSVSIRKKASRYLRAFSASILALLKVMGVARGVER